MQPATKPPDDRPIYWDTALSTPGKPPSWLTEVPRPMVRRVGFAGSAGGPSKNDKPAPLTEPLSTCGQSRRQAQAPGQPGESCRDLHTRVPALFFGAPDRPPHKERGGSIGWYSIVISIRPEQKHSSYWLAVLCLLYHDFLRDREYFPEDVGSEGI